MADDVDVGAVTDKIKCNYCSNKAVNKIVTCVTCKAVYHNSCVARVKSCVRDPKDDTVVMCCGKGEVNMKKSEINNHEVKALQEEVQLLRKLVKEMEDKNSLLSDKVQYLETALKEKDSASSLSYAKVVSDNKTQKHNIIKNIPDLVIKPINPQEANETNTDIKKYIKPSNLKVCVKSIKTKRNGSLSVKCDSGNDNKILQKALQEELGHKYTITEKTLKNPRIKIPGVEGEYSEKDIEEMLRAQNNIIKNSEMIKVIYIRRFRRKVTSTVYLETSPILFHKLMDAKKIYFDWQKLPVYEDLNINRCGRCCGYNHSFKKCTSPQHCSTCGGQHEAQDCKQEHKRCINCIHANEKYGKKYDTNHAAYETENCESYRFLKELTISNIDYGFSQ